MNVARACVITAFGVVAFGGTVVGAEEAGRLMTAAELKGFATGYYRHPRPELVAEAIKAFGPSGVVNEDSQVYIGFFAEVFAANPLQMVEWRRLIGRQEQPAQNYLRYALSLSRPGAVLALTRHSVELNEMYWGAFFASGNPAYLRKLADQLRFIDDRKDEHVFVIGANAMWSLGGIAPEDPVVRATLDAIRTEVDPRTRDLIDDLLRKDRFALQEEIREMRPESRQMTIDRGAIDYGPTLPGH